MSNSLKRILLLAGPLVVIAVVMISAVVFTHGRSEADTKGCNGKDSITHQVTIKDSQVSPQITDGKLCDRITIINKDAIDREIAFGPHEQHVAYDSVAERVLGKNQSLTLTFNKAGNFHFHDHEHDEVMGYFNVAK